jgi:hypothetical protein
MYDSIHCSRYLSGEKNEKARYRCCCLGRRYCQRLRRGSGRSALHEGSRGCCRRLQLDWLLHRWSGWLWGDNRTTEFVTATGLPTGFNQNYNTDGVVGGIHAGYNWQSGQFVFGLEGDLEGADIKGGYRLANTNGTDYRLRDQASIRGRLGVAFNNSLLYVTGGVAFADIEHTYVFANTRF